MEHVVLLILTMLYYMFSTIMIITYTEDGYFNKGWRIKLLYLLAILLIAPICVPIILGIKIGQAIKDE